MIIQKIKFISFLKSDFYLIIIIYQKRKTHCKNEFCIFNIFIASFFSSKVKNDNLYSSSFNSIKEIFIKYLYPRLCIYYI